ncbi:unnamed protein product [Medioppia subpectinata]|uniref:Proteasome alpha-type subunits domain-containing protein n=1 Tax=Medioppia subpectinata TaxID=1979941 RepID=A0A7R9KD80_9ACAR|nr:unnamed protein product [Medioppia subpectinata]CAG2099948.1 unnamed protein product [Medioppia subpectinata]
MNPHMSSFNYDSYIMFNPEGKVMQLDYARRATELGNTCVAVKGKDCGVLVAHNPLRSKLAHPQNKIYTISDNENCTALFTFSGITNDGLSIVEYLKDNALVENVVKDRNIHPIHVFDDLVVSMSFSALTGQSRLCGVSGILLTSESSGRVSITIINPDGKVSSVKGGSIGNRNQSCRTILEDEVDNFESMDVNELILVGLRSAVRRNLLSRGIPLSLKYRIWTKLIPRADCDYERYRAQPSSCEYQIHCFEPDLLERRSEELLEYLAQIDQAEINEELVVNIVQAFIKKSKDIMYTYKIIADIRCEELSDNLPIK